ncbi:exodeoxyribonuclease I [Ventosimonas gracilis]|uniref:Exodeoxyribonuclease I n=1 Tax=Ventosimonas gracilis TaxID=1680762 RepID=A0A139SXG8_9GAMM|nr:exodeoxyribonuclease I [Ventosimonas gracilis]
MPCSLLWYDYETTGIDPRRDRPLQVAAIRTDEAFNEIGEPLNLYCQLADDILPHPKACLVTGISPEQLKEQGLPEAEFIQKLHEQMAVPGTCTAGYNNLRFDDELTRHSLWRNFYDPYAREWQNGNSRWDLIDLLRAAYALRPQGIEWPEEDGQVSLRLELISAANGLLHSQAHDALSDVRATIELARLIKQKQPKLYDYCYRLRSKHEVQRQIKLLQPMLHVSGRFAAQRHYLAAVLPLAWHPHNRNALIVYDLHYDPTPLLHEEVDTLKQRLYTKRVDLIEGQLPLALKLLHINRCPLVAPLSVLREQDHQRLQLDMTCYQQRAAELIQTQSIWQDKLQTLYSEELKNSSQDPEQQLYGGFLSQADRHLCEQIRRMEPAQLAGHYLPFKDERLQKLLFRYRARNFPQSLTEDEKQQWQRFCQNRLSLDEYGAPNTLADFRSALNSSWEAASEMQQSLLLKWQSYVDSLAARFCL